MKSKRTMRLRFVLLSVATLLLFISSSVIHAQMSTFRKEFINNYITNNFTQQAELVKKNKDIMPDEIKFLVADALAKEKTYEQKMSLLGIASSMAAMYRFWHNDEKYIIEVETVLRMEVQKEKERPAEVEKWKKYEKFLGNIVLKEHDVQMAAEGLTPVIYPHWLHRIWFECKVCHDDIFVMKQRGNDITKARVFEGKQCGVCHNGKIAFGAQGDCTKCHNAGKLEAESLYDMTKINHKMVKEVATRIGAEWNPENLSNGVVPLDRFGYIKWLELKEKKVFNPINSLSKDVKDEIRDNQIFFESTSPVVNNVLFDHKIHSTWIQCSSCHPSIFIDKLGQNNMKMTDMSAGKFCGHCHGKVAFTFADCLRCHTQPKGEIPKGALIHKPQ